MIHEISGTSIVWKEVKDEKKKVTKVINDMYILLDFPSLFHPVW